MNAGLAQFAEKQISEPRLRSRTEAGAHLADSTRRSSEPPEQSSQTVNVLAYVHLRNIHASTGAGRVARQLTEHLALRKDVRLRILADARDKDRVLPIVGRPWTSFDYATFAQDTSRQQALWFALDRPLAEIFWPEAQIVFCTAESYVPTRSARLVVTAHDAAYFEAGAHARDRAFWTQRLKWRMLFGRLEKRADLFHTVSNFSAERLAHFFPAIENRLRVVPNAVSPHFFQPVPPAGREYLEHVELHQTPFVLVPGGLHFRKNADLILEALPQLLRSFPGVPVAIVNHSHPAYAERARALGANVRLLGFVEDAELHALYAAATAVWFPSRYEGFGLPVIEAMACGTPVVASDASSLPEISAGAAILVSPGDPGAHVRALGDLLTDPRARVQLGEKGREVAQKYTWQSSAQQLKQCFDEIL